VHVYRECVEEQRLVDIVRVFCQEGFLLRFTHVAVEGDGIVIVKNFVILHTDDIFDGIRQPHRGDQQRRTAADAQHHHKETLFVAENIAQADLVQKFEAVPYKRHILQQNALAERRRLRSDQLRGHIHKLRVAAVNRRAHTAEDRREDGKRAQRTVDNENEVGEVVHHAVSGPNNGREQIDAAEKADQTADQRGTARVEHVFSENPSLAAAVAVIVHTAVPVRRIAADIVTGEFNIAGAACTAQNALV